jgi:energy-coupling factor transporter ATP-binding protein EcfA2
LDLRIEAGERVLLTGPSGSGKSTLLRAVAGVLDSAAIGDLSGDVLVDRRRPLTEPGLVGLVQQDPMGGVVAEITGRDVAFGLENLRVPRADMRGRVAAALDAVRFPYEASRPTSALSGGEAQRLSLAGALVMSPRALLLDEPTSMLDPAAEEAVRGELQRAIESRGLTTVIADHDIARWSDWVDRIVVLNAVGEVIADGRPDAVLADQAAQLEAAGLWVPGLPIPTPHPIDSRLVRPRRSDGGHDLDDRLVEVSDIVVRRRPLLVGAPAVEIRFPAVEAVLRRGRGLGLTGPSGAGKSTLLQVLAGLLPPTSARVRTSAGWTPRRRAGGGPWTWRSRDLAKRIAWVTQLPEHAIVTSRVDEEVRVTARTLRMLTDEVERRCRGLLDTLGLSGLGSVSPYHLSGGEQRRLALVCALAHGPEAVLLDEPTVGQDRHTWAAVAGICSAARSGGVALAVASHDRRILDAIVDDELTLGAR